MSLRAQDSMKSSEEGKLQRQRTSFPDVTKGMRQRRFGGPAVSPQEGGDCWATAVASYAGLGTHSRNELQRRIVLSDLALKRHGKDPQEGSNWWNVTLRFLWAHGLRSIGVADSTKLDPIAVYIASGPGPRGLEHSVLVFGDGTLYSDPHPSGEGLIEITEWIGWWHTAETGSKHYALS